ncbi:MAG: hypothetical protein REI12_13825 [Pedobacter sp.]|nr:hypothetical protein [Pedobacter sp.]
MNNNEKSSQVILAGLEPLSRRSLLVSGARAAAAASALLSLPQQMLAADKIDGVPTGIKHLSEVEYRVLDKLRVVMLPTQKFSLPSSTQIPTMENVDAWVGKLNQRTRLLLTVGAQTLEYGSLYRFSRFSQMPDEKAAKHVHNWQTGNVVQRGVMTSLKMLLTLGYWQDLRTWPALQYDGPVSERWGIRTLGNAPLPR